MKPAIKVENGKVIVDFAIDQKMDKDNDGKASVALSSVNHLEIDAAELISEVLKKESALLEAVLSKMNYKPA